jgi:malonyl-CoA O-methyltransferase
MAEIQKHRVKKAFSSHAEQYEALALVQKRVVDRFFELFMGHGVIPGKLLDIGSGTGRLVSTFRQHLPQIAVTGIDLAFGMLLCAKKQFAGDADIMLTCGDAETLPFENSSFDMVVSTSTYQWLSPLGAPFAEVWRVLKPGGRFCFALFGEKTLYELRDSYSSAISLLHKGNADRTHQFASCSDVVSALKSASFVKIDVFDELEVENYPDVYSLIRAVNGIGAGSAARTIATGLAGRSVMLKMMDIYRERYGMKEVVPATYQVVYGTGTKAVAEQLRG